MMATSALLPHNKKQQITTAMNHFQSIIQNHGGFLVEAPDQKPDFENPEESAERTSSVDLVNLRLQGWRIGDGKKIVASNMPERLEKMKGNT